MDLSDKRRIGRNTENNMARCYPMTEGKETKVFISYSHDDFDVASKIARSLKRKGIKCWLDKANLEIGESLVERIELEMKNTDVLVPIVSRSYIKSKWAKFERQQLFGDYTDHSMPVVIPMRVDDTRIPVPWSNIKSVDARTDFEKAVYELVAELRQRFPNARPSPDDQDQIPEVPVLFVGRHKEIQTVLKVLQSEEGSRAVIVSGDPGSGKTVFSSLVAQVASKNYIFDKVVWIRMKGTPDSAILSMPQPVADALDPDFTKSTPGVLENRWLIVLDGFNEVHRESKHRWREYVQQLLKKHVRFRVLITARTKHMAELIDLAATHIQLAPLSDTDVIEYFSKRFSKIDEARFESLMETVRENRGLRELLHTPYFLGLTARLFEEKGIGYVKKLSEAETRKDAIEIWFNDQIKGLSQQEHEVLVALSFFEAPVSIRTLITLQGGIEPKTLQELLDRLVQMGLVIVEQDRYHLYHLAFVEFMRSRAQKRKQPRSGKALYVAIDPAIVTEEDFVEFLEALNDVYISLGGDELVIEEGEVGQFSSTGVLV